MQIDQLIEQSRKKKNDEFNLRILMQTNKKNKLKSNMAK